MADSTIVKTAQVFAVTILRYFFLAGVPFVIFYLLFPQKYSLAKIQPRQAKNKDFLREIGYSLLTAAVFAMISGVLFFSPLSKFTRVYTNLSDYPLWWIPVSFILSMIIHDTYFYWMHRLLHTDVLFRHTHLVHHKSINPSPWAAYSFHLLEAVAEGGILILLAFTLPMHPVAIFLFVVVGFVINAYGHLGYEIAPRWLRKSFLFEIVNTSVHHNLHHSKFKGNYGLYFRIWDRICKTEPPDYVKEYDKLQSVRFSSDREEVYDRPVHSSLQ